MTNVTKPPIQRYHAVAMVLHWTTALAVLALMASGLWMTEAIKVPQTQFTAFQTYQTHKSIGFLVLALTVARLMWRILHPTPQFPHSGDIWQERAAKSVHAAFYVALIVLPLLGWLAVSTSPFGIPTLWFGWFEIPHLPVEWTGISKATWEPLAKTGHWALALVTLGLIGLHISAALFHHVIKRDDVLQRMLPTRKRPK
jgi:cytochrome b561